MTCANAAVDLLRTEAFDEDPLRACCAPVNLQRASILLSRRARSWRCARPRRWWRRSARSASAMSSSNCSTRRVPSTGFGVDARRGIARARVSRSRRRLRRIEQNEWHAHADVYYHSLATLDAAPAGDQTLRLAALFHDVAKPQTKDGPHFYRHEILGEELTREILTRLRFSAEQTDTVAALVRAHMFAADPDMAVGRHDPALRAASGGRAPRAPLRPASSGHCRKRPPQARRSQRALRRRGAPRVGPAPTARGYRLGRRRPRRDRGSRRCGQAAGEFIRRPGGRASLASAAGSRHRRSDPERTAHTARTAARLGQRGLALTRPDRSLSRKTDRAGFGA